MLSCSANSLSHKYNTFKQNAIYSIANFIGDIAYVKNEYQYIGNGQVSKINHSEKTFGNYMQELTGYDNCQDAINNIDSWKSKDDIYKFYGVK